jgi:hypothetical protein
MEIAYDESYYALHRRKHPVLALDPKLILKGHPVCGEASAAGSNGVVAVLPVCRHIPQCKCVHRKNNTNKRTNKTGALRMFQPANLSFCNIHALSQPLLNLSELMVMTTTPGQATTASAATGSYAVTFEEYPLIITRKHLRGLI